MSEDASPRHPRSLGPDVGEGSASNPARNGGGRRTVLLLAALVALTLAMSLGRWVMEGAPRRFWRDAQPTANNEWCPDGMATRILIFKETLKGTSTAAQAYLDHLREFHQSSTSLVEWTAAPIALLGVEEAVAFAIVSSLASLLLVCLLWRWAGQELSRPRDRLWVLALFLAHPGTVRCFSRPQTDALLALFALLAVLGGRRAACCLGLSPGRRALLFATSALGCFVKIHALSLLLVVPAVAWLYGARGRRLRDATLYGLVLPALLWLAVFTAFDLFRSIEVAWQFKDKFYAQWDAALILRVLSVTSGGLLLAAALHPKPWRNLPAATALLTAGFAAILIVSELPPLVRFQYPVVAPLCLCAVVALRARCNDRCSTALFVSLLGLWYTVDAALVGMDIYGRYFGNPARHVPAWVVFLF